MSLLPSSDLPRVTHARETLRPRVANALDVMFVVIPENADSRVFAHLPEPQRWRELHARDKARSGTVRSTALANARQTQAVLGYLREGATPFERLALAGRMMKEASSRAADSIALAAPGDRRTNAVTLEALLAAAFAHGFSLPVFRSTREPRRRLREIVLLDGEGVDLRRASAAARGNNLTRWLTALPPNKLDARAYRRVIAEVARDNRLQFRWLDESALRRLGANAFLAVAAANQGDGAGIAHLRYRPARRAGREPDVALVGKGIIFDTGGVNLKPHKSMFDMHTDMSGSAVALATLVALAELRAPFAVDAWLAITENRIGPRAYKPQDIVEAANGVTIQVIHTDAEGRMALADTLALASRTQPRFIMDFATLTGASVYALTERMSSVFTNREALADKLVNAGRVSGERVWHFPFDADYDSDIESKVADVAQCSMDGKGDHILATRFLSRFVPESIAWAHVDLSSCTRSGGLGHINTEVTGFGVRFALEALLGQRVLEGLERPKK
ncbi:MAG: leucyl aminopeptidase family protein [Steroidobacteraceae bacterium]|nr:leucyl aminopeptidase family protein [Steroidobacteraceae bacterium]